MNKKTFIMALCMVGHSGYARLERELTAYEKKILQQQQQQYEARKKDVMNKVQMYRNTLNQLGHWNKKLLSMTDEIENWSKRSRRDAEIQEVLAFVKRTVPEVVNNGKKVRNDYKGAWQGLSNDFNDCFRRDAGLRRVLDGLKQEQDKLIHTFNGNSDKLRDTMRKLQETMGATLAQKRQQKAVSENLDKAKGKSVPEVCVPEKDQELQEFKKETIQEEKKETEQDLREMLSISTKAVQDRDSAYDPPL